MLLLYKEPSSALIQFMVQMYYQQSSNETEPNSASLSSCQEHTKASFSPTRPILLAGKKASKYEGHFITPLSIDGAKNQLRLGDLSDSTRRIVLRTLRTIMCH